MVKKAQKKSILSSALITVFIVIMLIISGPAQAVSVIISGLQNDPYIRGNSVNFTISVNITSPDESVPVTNISLDVTGHHVSLNRTFALNGTPISGDPTITILPVSTPRPDQFGYGYGYGVDSRSGTGHNFGYGYGYGYGYGAGGGIITYTYNVSIDTTSLPDDSYTAVASLNTGKADKPAFVSAEETFRIIVAPYPEIITWGNNKTGDASLSIAVNQSETVHFNATANQTITLWKWYVDGVDRSNNADNLSHNFSVVGSHTVKVNATNDNGTSDTVTWNIDAKDITPPSSIAGLHNASYARDYINWTWTDPADSDFSKVIVSIDGGSTFNVSIGTQFYNATGFAPDTEHTIATRTVDTSGNINQTWVNRTDRTAPAPSACNGTAGCIEVPITTDESGKTTTTVTEESPSGDLTVTIPAGTRALDKDGTPLSSITITSLADLPSKASKKLSSKDRPVGEFVELGPSGATFAPPIQIRFNYTEPLPDGVSESSLQIRTYNATTDSWEVLSDIVKRDTESNYIIANVSHFSTFALIGTVSEEPSTRPVGSSGGSSSGGGVITLEPYENIAKAESQERDLIAGKPVLYTFTTPELSVYELAVTGKESENDISIRVESLKGTSKLVTSPAPGTVYKNVNIWAGTKRLKEAIIRLKVENSWLDGNNFATGDTKMVKWNGNKWILLDTAETGKDASYTYFEVKTDTFSIFAITELKSGVIPTTTPTVTQQPEETSTGTGTAGTVTTTQTPSSEAPPVNLATIIFVIVLIAIVAVVYFKRKEIFKK